MHHDLVLLFFLYVVIDEAVSGTTIATAKTSQWTNRLKDAGLTALILFIGRNDIDSGTAASTVLADMATVADEATAAGLNVLTISAPPYGNAGSWTAGEQTQLDTFNAGLASAASGCRQHLDIYADLEEPTDTDDLAAAYDSGDGIHLNQTGQDAIEALVRPLIGP